MALPTEFMEELRRRTPLPSLIARRVKLARSGRQWKGCCPFHGEKTPSFFVNTRGRRLAYATVQQVFNKLTNAAGLRARSETCRPRIHDIRHSLACATLIGWYRDGVDVQAELPVLSAWLGHTRPENSYWYLSAVPELLALAAEKRRQHQERSHS